jgi:hypothetical protein
LECAVQSCIAATRDIRNQLISTAQEQTADLSNTVKGGLQLLSVLTNTALACDEMRTQHSAQCFTQHIEHVVEVCHIGKL